MKRIIFISLLLLCAGMQSSDARVVTNMYTSGNKIAKMVYTGNSIICATAGGVVFWDTRTMTYKKYTYADGLPSNNVTSIALAPDGKVWCGTDMGIASYDGKSWTIYRNIPNGFRNYSMTANVFDITVTPDGVVWATAAASNPYGVVRFKDGEWTWLTSQDGIPEGYPTKIAFGSDGSMAVGSNTNGLAVFNGSSKKIYKVTDGLPDNFVTAIAMKDAHTIWAGTNLGLAKFDGVSWKTYTVKDGLLSDVIYGIDFTPDGKLYVGTMLGVSVYDGSSFTGITTSQGLAHNIVTSVLTGSDGTRWFGTRYGLTGEKNNVYTTYRTKNEPIGSEIYDSTLAPDGSVWFTTLNGGVSRYFNGVWTNYSAGDGLLDNYYFSIAAGNDGSIWVGSSNKGVYRFDGKKWSSFSTKDGLVSDRIDAVAIDQQGVVWCGCNMGNPNALCYFKDGKWTQVSTNDGLASTRVWDIAVGPDNAVWVATDKGVSRFAGGKWETFLPGTNIFRVHILKDNTAVFASYTSGVIFFDGTNTRSPKNYQVSLIHFLDIDGSSLDNLILASSGIFEHVTDDTCYWYIEHTGATYNIASVKVMQILPFHVIHTVTIDNNGTWWCGGSGQSTGIFTVEKGKDEIPLAVRSEELPRNFSIHGNYPNPFNPSTTIEYSLPETGKASLVIYSISGQKVRELVSGNMPAGAHSVLWDGRDDLGKPVSSGVYMSRLESSGKSVAGRMLFMK
jgi:ligand-binding sensor domain-containing protein